MAGQSNRMGRACRQRFAAVRAIVAAATLDRMTLCLLTFGKFNMRKHCAGLELMRPMLMGWQRKHSTSLTNPT